MSISNGLFKWDDKTAIRIAGYELPDAWWSRKYEYPWALQFTHSSFRVADMGTGWMVRPFKDALAVMCDYVYAVDLDRRLLEQHRADNMEFIVADFTKPVSGIEPASLDRIFCISVLEDMGDMIGDAIAEFKRLLKPDGLMVLTFDVQYDMDKPLGKYPGVNLQKLSKALSDNDLVVDGDIVIDRNDAVYHKDFNLCCMHLKVKHANN